MGIRNHIENYNKNVDKIKSKYQKLKAIEILKILLDYGITAVSGLSCIALLNVLCNSDFDPSLSEEVSKFIGVLLGGGAIATGIFSLEYPYITKDKRKERYNNIREYSETKNDLYKICVCDESEEVITSIKRG